MDSSNDRPIISFGPGVFACATCGGRRSEAGHFFYGQLSVAEPGPTNSPWSINIYELF